MKKALALFMALVMICSVVATLSTVSATGAQAAPVLDGVISDGEYTYSVTTNVNDLSAGAKTEVEGTEVVEYFAYNATYLYYGIVFTQTADNRACWPQMKVNNTFNVYSNETGTVNYYHSRAALQARYLEDGTTKNNGISAPAGGTTPVFNTDMFVTAAKDANNVKTYEFKFARAYFAANAGCEAADVRVVPMWTWFHDQTSTAHILTAEDMLNLEDAGVGTINDFGQGGTMYNFVVLDSEAKDETYENLANELGLVYYVGEPVAEEPIPEPDPYTEINLEKLYGATYVGKALTEEDAKPVQDGVIGENEYQAMYFVSEDGSKDVMRRGAKTDLRNDYKEYIAHDAEWIYFAAEFDNVTTDTRGRFYWNLFFVDSFDVEYYGGKTANEAFVQNGNGIKDGWLYGGEVKANIAEGYSERNNSVTSGTLPVINQDFYVGVGKEDLGESEWAGWYNGHQVYEFKVSKAWYAAQAGLASAEEVVNLAWITMGQQINGGGSAYTQIGHIVTDSEYATLAATGTEYTANGTNWDLDDDKVLPRLFVLDTDWEKATHDLGLNTYVGKEMEVSPVLDGVVNEGEYSYSRTWSEGDIYQFGAEIQSGVVEHIAHDADYIYYAVVFEQANNNRALQWQFSPLNSTAIFNNKDNLKNTLFQRITWQLRYQDDGTTTLHETPKFNYAQDFPAPEVGAGLDLEYAATKTAGNVKTYEIKLAKAYIAEYADTYVDQVRVLPYFTYFHSACALGHNYTTAETEILEDLGATRADPGLIYRFIILDDAPEAASETENLDVATKNAASVRLSTTHPGLRFTTTVNTLELNALVAQYGAENVKVGTLIAPADVLGEDALTIDTATKIDVVASLANPFAQNCATSTYAGSITNIKPQNLTRDFTAVGYVAYSVDGENWTYVYSETTCTRNVTEIAQAAVDAGEFAEDADALEILQNLGAVVA